jgi:hypothetical protein
MIVKCGDETGVGRAGCGRLFDDAQQWTICPHGPLWAGADRYCVEHDLVDCVFHEARRPPREEEAAP